MNIAKDDIEYPINIDADRENNMSLRIRDYILKDGYDSPKYHQGSSTIFHISSNHEKIKWKLVDDGQSGETIMFMLADPKLIDPKGISLPKEIILTKIEYPAL